jgi:hypothetical protein
MSDNHAGEDTSELVVIAAQDFREVYSGTGGGSCLL